jgi:hypothetical protein
MDEKYIKLQSNEAGPFTKQNKNFSVTIPSSLGYADLRRSYLELQIKIDTTDGNPASGEGVYVTNLKYKNSTNPLHNAGLLRRAILDSDKMKSVEAIQDVNVLVSNLAQLTESRSGHLSGQYQSTAQRFDEFENKYSIFTNINKSGSIESSQTVARVPVMLEDLFGLCKIEDYDFSVLGDLLIRCQLDLDNIESEIIIADNTSTTQVSLTPAPSIAAYNLTNGGTGYNVDDEGDLTGGSGSGATYKVLTEAGNVVATLEITNAGLGYKVDDVLTLAGHGGANATITLTEVDAITFITTEDITPAQLAAQGYPVNGRVYLAWEFNGVPADADRMITAVAANAADAAKCDVTFDFTVQKETAAGDAITNAGMKSKHKNHWVNDITSVADGTDVTALTLTSNFNSLDQLPFWVGQKVEPHFIKTVAIGGVKTVVNEYRKISNITWDNETGVVTINLDNSLVTLANGDTLTGGMIDVGSFGSTSSFQVIGADCVVVQKAEGNPNKNEQYSIMTYELERHNGNGNTNFNQQVNLPPSCSSCLILPVPSTTLYAANQNVTNYRCKVDDDFTSDRSVEMQSSLYYDQVNGLLMNCGKAYENNIKIVDTGVEQIVDAENQANNLNMIPVVAPMTAQTKNLQVNINSGGGGINNLFFYKRCMKVCPPMA